MEDAIKQKIFQQVMDIWIIPEIERRKKEGKIKGEFNISKMQVVFSLENGKNEIRLNEEVKAIVRGKVNRDVLKGEPVYEKDIDIIEGVELTDEDINCGHITLLLFKNSWIVSFDFRYNKEKVKNHINASKEFYEVAVESLSKNRIRAFYENAFASAELSAISILITLPSREILECRNHKKRLSQFKDWANLGNVEMKFNTTLSKLSELRDSARYLHSEKFKEEDPNQIKDIIKEMINFAENSIN